MTARDRWLKAFPLPQAEQAVRATLESWRIMASKPRPHFNYQTHEPALTRVLAAHLRDVVSPQMGLSGLWGPEQLGNAVDFETGELLKEFRTDIGYFWMNGKKRLDLVFEYKRLAGTGTSRKQYMGERGLLKFVTGPYSKRQPVALMVGLMMDRKPENQAGLERAMQQRSFVSDSRLRRDTSGQILSRPSQVFGELVAFDTEHLRSADKAPEHGTIKISHLFLQFSYEPPAEKSRAEVMDELEDRF